MTEAEQALRGEVEWLTTALANARELRRLSPEYLRGFEAAIGWVKFHADRMANS